MKLINKNSLFLIVIFVFGAAAAHSQDMNQGFTYLENGNYEKAKVFFTDILTEYPDNRTAKLCYGRAIGLLGESSKAVSIFTELKRLYPDDFEIKLNYAEALLWNQNYEKAESYYANLVTEQPKNFAAVLGYANTLSNLKKYESALEWVNTALNLQPKNTNALISRKYIRLGYAFMLSQDKQYESAIMMLDKNLIDFPDDKDTLLNKANIYVITEEYTNAKDSYYRIAKNSTDSIIALQGLSLIAHKTNKNTKALVLAKNAIGKTNDISDKEAIFTANERYIQALLWNRKFKDANTAVEALRQKYPNELRVLSLEATYGMFTSRFDISLDRYKRILDTTQNSFDGNLGISNVYRALGSDNKSYEYAFKTLSYYPKQPDAEMLISTLKKTHTPYIENKTAFTFDNGDNEAITTSTNIEIPLSTKLKIKGTHAFRTTENTTTDTKATSNSFSAGLDYKFNGNVGIKTNIGINAANADTNSYSQITAEASIHLKPFRLQNLDLGYRRELQNFNADLIDREIVMNNYFITYNLGTNINLGWYTQAIYTTQSDDNTRNLLFTSLYYTWVHKPVLKTGVNYQYISFKDQVPEIYFSPDSFNLVELFAEFLNDPNQQWFYSLSAAVGRQFVEDDPASTTFRAEGKIGHHFSKRFMANIYGKYSNIASATAAGFEFTEIGFHLKWYFLKKPIFDKKIIAIQDNVTTTN